MKRRFFRVLPLVVAVLLATSCSKDENNDKEVVNSGTEVVTPENNVKTVPFTLKVKNGKGISKVSYSDNGDEVQPSFEVGDKVAISGTGISNTELTCEKVENGAAVFTGDIASGIADGTTLTATVKVNESSTIVSSTTSMVDLIEKCAHTYEGTFEYTNGVDAECILKDDKSYLEFTLAEGQKKVSVNGTWYDVDQAFHKAWVAVNGGTNVTTRIKGSKQVTAGVIYTIECTDVVDLGPDWNILWKAANEIENSSLVFQGLAYYDWAAAEVFASQDANGYRLPTKTEMESLYALAQAGYVDKDNVSYKEFSNEYGSVFLQPAGYKDSDDDPVLGVGAYWTNTVYNSERMWRLKFNTGANNIGVNDGDLKSCHLSVRLVRGL